MLESPALPRVKELSSHFMKITQGVLEKNIGMLHAVADALKANETLSEDEVLEVIGSAGSVGRIGKL
jgi:ATP-dependent Zn protease